jgi:[acyl-carrier-protein] S-malonyltransferase
MGVIALFPGQGSQAPGMGKSFHQTFALARELFDLASETLKLDLKKLCFESGEEELARTENTQPCLLLVSYCGFKILEQETGFAPIAAAGHSLGEYTALTAAGALTFPDALRLVRKRGELMAQAASGDTGMMAVLGADRAQAESICREAVRENEILSPANFNAPGQVVISGHAAALDRAQALLKGKRMRGIRLKVSGAFHTPLMKDAADGLKEILNSVNFSAAKFPVVSNLEAKPYSGDQREILVRHLTSPVRFEDSILCLKQMGAADFLEIGPGKVLSGLVERTLPGARTLNFSESTDLDAVKTWLNG